MLSTGPISSFSGSFTGVPLVAIYWTDLITTVQGDIHYRESRDFLEQSRVRSLIREHKNDFQFIPTYLGIITWDDVHEFSLKNRVSIEEGILFRSSHWRCSVEKGVLQNLAKFTRKTPVLESLYNKVAGLQVSNFIKRDSSTVPPCEICKI